MQTSRKQSNLTKAVRFVIRSLSHGHSQVPGTISSAVRRYQVSPHDIWVAIQSTEH
jgi:hypothetical protein